MNKEKALEILYKPVESSSLQSLVDEISTIDVDCPFKVEIKEHILESMKIFNEISGGGYYNNDREKLFRDNKTIFKLRFNDQYKDSFANPDNYREDQLESDRVKGAYLVSFYRILSISIYENYLNGLEFLLTEVRNFLKNEVDSSSLKEFTSKTIENIDMVMQLKTTVLEHNRLGSIVRAIADNTTLAFSYGVPLNETDFTIANFYTDMEEEKLNKLARNIANGYIRGFEQDNKDYSKKEYYKIIYSVGQEPLVIKVSEILNEKGLKPMVMEPQTSVTNKQLGFDHQNNDTLTIDQEMVDSRLALYQSHYESLKDDLRANSGVVYISRFGEKPFEPVVKSKRVIATPDKTALRNALQGRFMALHNQFAPRAETSFCIVAFPTPEIGEQFDEIFEKIVEINLLNTDEYEKMQEAIIDTLDKGEYVHVKGYNGNRTDIKVSLNSLKDPTLETNFVNCGADVNIPVGEVFTSPVLSKTDGLLHIPSVYLQGFLFKDLWLDFKDGEVVDYGCKNFDDDDKNRTYVKENLMANRENLPLGEFAIGTNTLAYTVSKRYGIEQHLPILIYEKTGPHFAIGDTCFSRSEDVVVKNPISKKEVIARHNERSRLEDPLKAYTNVHVDITLPFDEIKFITAVDGKDNRFDIIVDGKFVVEGSMELNKGFEL